MLSKKILIIAGAVGGVVIISASAVGGYYVVNKLKENSELLNQRTFLMSDRGLRGGVNNRLDDSAYIDSLAKEDISDAEKTSLVYMREEEKLARDVYTTLYKKWGQGTFNIISQSEQRHMDMIGDILTKYGIEDPMKNNETGVFTNPEFTKLYSALISQGEKSLVDAYKVGLKIEELDINDLDKSLKNVNNQDITFVFQNLRDASKQHLRSFNRSLVRLNETYKPEYISQDLYDEILSQQGNGNGMMRKGGGRGMGR